MTKDDFIKQFRAHMYELALESFHQARLHSGKDVPVLKTLLADVLLGQMQTATALLGKMYDAMHQKETKDVPPGKTK